HCRVVVVARTRPPEAVPRNRPVPSWCQVIGSSQQTLRLEARYGLTRCASPHILSVCEPKFSRCERFAAETPLPANEDAPLGADRDAARRVLTKENHR